MDLKKLGTIIHDKREEIGIPPSTLAEKAGISRPTLWIWERGENPKTGKPSRPSKNALERLAEVLHMSQEEMEELLSLADYTVNQQTGVMSGQILSTIQSDVSQQDPLFQPNTIVKVDGTVYLAANGYLQAFDAKSGNRLWCSSTNASPLEPAHDFVAGRIEQAWPSMPAKTDDLYEYVQKVAESNIRDIAMKNTRPDTKVSELPTLELANDKVVHVIEALRERISSGEFGWSGRLPSLQELAIAYGTSQEMMNKVLQSLQAEGWLLLLGSKGHFVNMLHVRMPGLTPDPYRYFEEQGLPTVVENVESVKVIEPPLEIAMIMNLPKEALVVRRFRKYILAEVPSRISEAYFPKKFVPNTTLKNMEDPYFNVLPEVQKQMREVISDVHEEIVVRLPTTYEQEQLKIIQNHPVLDIKRISHAENKELVIMLNHIVLNAYRFNLSYDYPASK